MQDRSALLTSKGDLTQLTLSQIENQSFALNHTLKKSVLRQLLKPKCDDYTSFNRERQGLPKLHSRSFDVEKLRVKIDYLKNRYDTPKVDSSIDKSLFISKKKKKDEQSRHRIFEKLEATVRSVILDTHKRTERKISLVDVLQRDAHGTPSYRPIMYFSKGNNYYEWFLIKEAAGKTKTNMYQHSKLITSSCLVTLTESELLMKNHDLSDKLNPSLFLKEASMFKQLQKFLFFQKFKEIKALKTWLYLSKKKYFQRKRDKLNSRLLILNDKFKDLANSLHVNTQELTETFCFKFNYSESALIHKFLSNIYEQTKQIAHSLNSKIKHGVYFSIKKLVDEYEQSVHMNKTRAKILRDDQINEIRYQTIKQVIVKENVNLSKYKIMLDLRAKNNERRLQNTNFMKTVDLKHAGYEQLTKEFPRLMNLLGVILVNLKVALCHNYLENLLLFLSSDLTDALSNAPFGPVLSTLSINKGTFGLEPECEKVIADFDRHVSDSIEMICGFIYGFPKKIIKRLQAELPEETFKEWVTMISTNIIGTDEKSKFGSFLAIEKKRIALKNLIQQNFHKLVRMSNLISIRVIDLEDDLNNMKHSIQANSFYDYSHKIEVFDNLEQMFKKIPKTKNCNLIQIDNRQKYFELQLKMKELSQDFTSKLISLLHLHLHELEGYVQSFESKLEPNLNDLDSFARYYKSFKAFLSQRISVQYTIDHMKKAAEYVAKKRTNHESSTDVENLREQIQLITERDKIVEKSLPFMQRRVETIYPLFKDETIELMKESNARIESRTKQIIGCFNKLIISDNFDKEMAGLVSLEANIQELLAKRTYLIALSNSLNVKPIEADCPAPQMFRSILKYAKKYREFITTKNQLLEATLFDLSKPSFESDLRKFQAYFDTQLTYDSMAFFAVKASRQIQDLLADLQTIKVLISEDNRKEFSEWILCVKMDVITQAMELNPSFNEFTMNRIKISWIIKALRAHPYIAKHKVKIPQRMFKLKPSGLVIMKFANQHKKDVKFAGSYLNLS